MYIQSKIASALSNTRRRLHDYKVHVSGIEMLHMRFDLEINRYRDKTMTLVSQSSIPVAMKIPADMPIYTLRGENNDSSGLISIEAPMLGLHIHNSLPIVAHVPFEAQLERGDGLAHIVYSHYDSEFKPVYAVLLLQVTESLGNIDQGHVVKRVYHCAPFPSALPKTIWDTVYPDIQKMAEGNH